MCFGALWGQIWGQLYKEVMQTLVINGFIKS